MSGAMRDKLAQIAAERGVRDPVHINAWSADETGEPRREPGRQVSIVYHRADGGKRIKAQTGKAWPGKGRAP